MFIQVDLRYHDRNDKCDYIKPVWVLSQDLPHDTGVKEGTPVKEYKKDLCFSFTNPPLGDFYTAEGAWCNSPGEMIADGIHRED